jgi:hypothetical protein
MRVFITVLVLIFSFQSWTKADDIRDFQIEGMSIGDSALDYFSKSEIKKTKTFMYNSKKYYSFTSQKYKSKYYEAVQIHIKKNDKKYEISTIEGLRIFNDDIIGCNRLKDQILNEILSLFPEANVTGKKGSHDYDKSGESKYYKKSITINKTKYPGITLICNDWSKKLQNKFNDMLSVIITQDSFEDFMFYEAYK